MLRSQGSRCWLLFSLPVKQTPFSYQGFFRAKFFCKHPRDLSINSGFCGYQFRSVQSLSRVQLFVTPWIAARQASLSITNSQSSFKLMSIESVMHPAISSSVVPFSSCPQFLPAWVFSNVCQLFTWGGQSAGVSALASVLPMNTQSFQWTPRTDLL